MFNKRIVMSLLVLGLLICVASAGTWAYFDSSQSASGSIATGTMKLDISDGINPSLVPLSLDHVIEPNNNVVDGFIGNPIVPYNIGSLNGVLYVTAERSISDDNSLAKDIILLAYVGSPDPRYASGIYEIWNGRNGDGGHEHQLYVLNSHSAPGASIYIKYLFPKTSVSQNDVQGHSFNFNVKFDLKQS